MAHFCYILGLLIMLVAGEWVFGPIKLAAEERSCRFQFTLADILCLFVFAHLALGMVSWEVQAEGGGSVVIADTIVGLVVVLGWWSFVRMLSRAGIRIVRQRCVLMLVVLPVSAIGSYAVAFIPFALVDLFTSRSNIFRDICILLAGSLLPFVIYRLGHFTRAIVASAAKE